MPIRKLSDNFFIHGSVSPTPSFVFGFLSHSLEASIYPSKAMAMVVVQPIFYAAHEAAENKFTCMPQIQLVAVASAFSLIACINCFNFNKKNAT